MKKLMILLFITFYSTSGLFAQSDLLAVVHSFEGEETVEDKHSDEYIKEMISKELKLLSLYLSNEIEYPEMARKYNKEGRVLVRVVFDGEIKKISVVKSLSPACDALVLEKLKTYAKNWDRKDYEDIPRLTLEIPVDFKLRG